MDNATYLKATDLNSKISALKRSIEADKKDFDYSGIVGIDKTEFPELFVKVCEEVISGREAEVKRLQKEFEKL